MENQVREISLRHLFWKVMLGWKLWIVCAVLFAILLPGVKYVKDIPAGFNNSVNVLFPEPLGPANTMISGFFSNTFTVTPLSYAISYNDLSSVAFLLINFLSFPII